MRGTLAVLMAIAVPAMAQDDAGEALFLAYCAGCHGTSGQGDGPIAGLLTVPVADLTQLTTRNGGTFPLVRTIRLIEGDPLLRAHGGPMPVFGALGGGSAVVDAADGMPVQTRRDVLEIVTYLEGQQR